MSIRLLVAFAISSSRVMLWLVKSVITGCGHQLRKFSPDWVEVRPIGSRGSIRMMFRNWWCFTR